VLTHFSWTVFGDHVWTVRLPAFLAGIALIPASYLVGRALYDRRAGLCAAALTAAAAPFVEYSVNGRGYTLGVLLVLTSLWLATRLPERSSRWLWAAFVLCSTLAVYTVPTMAYGVVTVAVWMGMVALLGPGPRKVRLVGELALALALIAALSVLLYAPVLGQPGWTAVDPVPVRWSPLGRLVSSVWENWNRDARHPLDWIVAAGFLGSLVLHRRIARHASRWRRRRP
jgi:4-amino-4-deoxy-L-arabinose transferase-like glycosyltransferase